jgi:putative lipoprotein
LPTVTGTVRLSDAVPPGATLRVRVEDVSRMDAPSFTLAETATPIPAGAPAGTELPFTLVTPDPDPTASLNVRAHVDVSGSGTVDSGDLVSTAAHPVLTHGHPDRIIVEARRV